MKNIVIINYGMGNLRSVQKAFERVSIEAKISSKKEDIINADKLLLPGVGHFKQGINNLKNRGLFDLLNEMIIEKNKPILGICLGMQLMTEFSEEGNCSGFGWIKAQTKKFVFNENGLKIPHMGWNNLFIRNNDTIYRDTTIDNFFYFVHSYYIFCENESDIIAETEYGIKFVSSFQKKNIFGCQFHPEKSHGSGLQLLKNFAEI